MTRDWFAVCGLLGWPDGSQDGTPGPMVAQGGPGWPQDGPKMRDTAPQMAQDGATMGPRCGTVGPILVQEREPRGASRPPVDAKMRPRWSPKLVKMTQKTPKVIMVAVVLERVMLIGGEI